MGGGRRRRTLKSPGPRCRRLAESYASGDRWSPARRRTGARCAPADRPVGPPGDFASDTTPGSAARLRPRGGRSRGADEDIGAAAILGDEAETLFRVEPFDGTGTGTWTVSSGGRRLAGTHPALRVRVDLGSRSGPWRQVAVIDRAWSSANVTDPGACRHDRTADASGRRRPVLLPQPSSTARPAVQPDRTGRPYALPRAVEATDVTRRRQDGVPSGARWRCWRHWAWLALAAAAGTVSGAAIARRDARLRAGAGSTLTARLLRPSATRSSSDGEDPCTPSSRS